MVLLYAFIFLIQIQQNNIYILLPRQGFITELDFVLKAILTSTLVFAFKLYKFIIIVIEKINTTVNDGSPGGSEHFNCFWLYHVNTTKYVRLDSISKNFILSTTKYIY